jgi:predicted component of type VI protein secretion system
MALQQLILKPHYWEKTTHGLHLQTAGASPSVTLVTEQPSRVSVVENMECLLNTSLPENDEQVKMLPPASEDSLSILPVPELETKEE